MEQSLTKPWTARYILQSIQTFAEDVVIWAVEWQHSVNPRLTSLEKYSCLLAYLLRPTWFYWFSIFPVLTFDEKHGIIQIAWALLFSIERGAPPWHIFDQTPLPFPEERDLPVTAAEALFLALGIFATECKNIAITYWILSSSIYRTSR